MVPVISTTRGEFKSDLSQRKNKSQKAITKQGEAVQTEQIRLLLNLTDGHYYIDFD